MITRVYEMEELTDSAEMLRDGPPWWFHAGLLLLLAIILLAAPMIAVLLGRISAGS